MLPLHHTSMCGASSQDRTDHLILTMDTLYLLSYGSINGVVDRIRTCISYKGLLAFQASAPPAERLRHFGVRPRTRTGTSLTRLLEIFKTSALPIRLKRTYLASRVRLELTHRFKRFDSFRNCSCTIEASRHYWRSLWDSNPCLRCQRP